MSGMETLFGKAGKIRSNIIPDILENFDRGAPPAFERTRNSPHEGQKALDLLCPPELREKIARLTEGMESGVYRARIIAGSKEKETSHPHDFIIEKDEKGVTLLFLDPEHHIGTRSSRRSWVENLTKLESTLRPPVGNLMMLNLPQDASLEVAITRYRTEGVAKTNQHVVTNMEAQYQGAQNLIENKGIPGFLHGHKDAVLFRALVTEETMTLQARGIEEADADSFFSGTPATALLKGKIEAQRGLLHRFLKLLEEGQFEKLPTPALRQ